MNQELTALYNSKWNSLVANSKDTDATYPLLIKVNDEYQNADIKVMIVGQETDGWCGVLEENKKDINSVQETYFNYLYKSKDKNRRPFWNRKNFKYFQEELKKKFLSKKVAFIWNNVSKIGMNYSGEATEKVKNLEKEYFNVFEDELKILKPDIIIFTIGNRTIPMKYKQNEIIEKMPISEINFLDYQNIVAVKTYHPNARIKGGKKEFNKEIVNFIVSKI